MVKLITFAACENVLHDDRNNPSLIGLFSAMDVGLVSGQNFPLDAVSPQTWKVFTQWNAEEEDLGKEFTQKLTITSPDGREFGNSSTDFKLATRSHNLHVTVEGMPVGAAGSIVMKVWLKSGTKTITAIHETEISIRQVKGPKP